jgi:hypothetical protein
LIGYETIYARNMTDEQLVRSALSEKYTLLTSDLGLYRLATAKGAETYLVKGRNEAERLAQLSRRFRFDLKIDTRKSRCPECGSKLRRVPKNTVESKVPPTTFKTFRNFWECSAADCRKTYWRGSHWKNIMEVLAEAGRLKSAS